MIEGGLRDVAEDEFLRLTRNAQDALNALDRFWTKLYGPNEALSDAHSALLAMDREWFGDEVVGGLDVTPFDHALIRFLNERVGSARSPEWKVDAEGDGEWEIRLWLEGDFAGSFRITANGSELLVAP